MYANYISNKYHKNALRIVIKILSKRIYPVFMRSNFSVHRNCVLLKEIENKIKKLEIPMSNKWCLPELSYI